MLRILSSHRVRRPVAALIASLALAGMVGCSGGGDPADSGPSSDTQQTPSTPTAAAPSSAAQSSAAPSSETSSTSNQGDDGAALLKAGAAAVANVPDSTLTSIEREEGGWEVQVVTADGTEHQLDLNADGTQVLRGPTEERDDAEDKAEHKDRVAVAKIDYRAAVKAVLEAVQGGEITELNLDSERGTTVWEADVLDAKQQKHEVRIDAVTGKVLRNAIDD